MPGPAAAAEALQKIIAGDPARDAASLSVGSAIRDRRRRLGLTLQVLADRAGLSAPFISQVERGQASPSIVSLMGIAKALGVDINYFVSVPHQGQLVRRGADPEFVDAGIPVEYRRLSGDHEERKMEALLMAIPPGLSAPTTQREGEGFWYVLDGELEMEIGGDRFILGVGDSAHFDQRHPYKVSNPGERPVRVLWVGTPALF
ncbi:XRE family transcriptional regulator [Caulobacter sp. CCUG 60055]|uniref:helix-turn-helix domain-containing protein n=1 Tax=Caulobacter sp. CCUG 60055 TaxID=2100090 RepID=UPI001FA7CEBD|nr:cupin domain-containing protein [Caulobacter sp. CCUG 60055]MBQ1542539.1 cupin domain-containing protein [Caulobacteraceae bacterium]MCI3180391.1 XRE family transcriptional regulator [Caulobacter sp. CCUG 60055]